MREFVKAAIFTFAAVSIMSIALDMFIGIFDKDGIENEVTTDTIQVIVHDTIFQKELVPVERNVVSYINVEVKDTVVINDTVFQILPIEQVVYEDSLYKAWVSGYRPSLDSILIHHPATYTTYTTTITQKKTSKWGVGLSAGYGMTNSGLSPYVGIGVTYSILGW